MALHEMITGRKLELHVPRKFGITEAIVAAARDPELGWITDVARKQIIELGGDASMQGVRQILGAADTGRFEQHVRWFLDCTNCNEPRYELVEIRGERGYSRICGQCLLFAAGIPLPDLAVNIDGDVKQ